MNDRNVEAPVEQAAIDAGDLPSFLIRDFIDRRVERTEPEVSKDPIFYQSAEDRGEGDTKVS